MWIIVIILYLIVYGIIPTLFYRIWNRKQKKNRREKEIENIYLTFDDGVDNKYTIEVLGETIKFLEKNDGSGFHDIGKSIAIYVNPKDIMQF